MYKCHIKQCMLTLLLNKHNPIRLRRYHTLTFELSLFRLPFFFCFILNIGPSFCGPMTEIQNGNYIITQYWYVLSSRNSTPRQRCCPHLIEGCSLIPMANTSTTLPPFSCSIETLYNYVKETVKLCHYA